MERWWLLALSILHYAPGLKTDTGSLGSGSLWPFWDSAPKVKEEVEIRSVCSHEQRVEFLETFGLIDRVDIPNRTNTWSFEGSFDDPDYNFTKNSLFYASNRAKLRRAPLTEALLLLPYARRASDNAFLLNAEMCRIMLDLHYAGVGVTFHRVTGITEAAEKISEYPARSLGWVSLGGHGDGKTLAWVPKGGFSDYSIAAMEEAGVQAGLIEGQSFVAGGKQSKALLDLLAERLQPSALLYMMSCHAGVCPRLTRFNRGIYSMGTIFLGTVTALHAAAVAGALATPVGALATVGNLWTVGNTLATVGSATAAVKGAATMASSESLAEWTSKYLGTKGRSDVRVYAPGDSFNAVVVEPDASTGVPVPIRAGNDYQQEPQVVKMHVFQGGENVTEKAVPHWTG
jgi:hypothetical protein